MTARRNIIALSVALIVTAGSAGALGYALGRSNEPQVRFDERKRDLEVLFDAFEACEDDPACEDQFRYAYFELRADQERRDFVDRLESFYEDHPMLRPEESSAE